MPRSAVRRSGRNSVKGCSKFTSAIRQAFKSVFGEPLNSWAAKSAPATATQTFCEPLEQRLLLSTTSFYVATTGNDTNAGTLAAPFQHIQKALNAFGSSNTGTVYVEAGTYVLGDGSTNNTSGLSMPSQGGITLTNYNGGAVYIVGGLTVNSSDSSGWTQYSGNVYETTLSGQLAYIDNDSSDISTVQEIFQNFNVTNTGTMQTMLTEYGSDGGFVNTYRENQLALPGGSVSNLPTGSWYINGFSNTLYVNVGGGSPGTTLTAANPNVLQDLTGGASGDVVSHLTFEIADSSGAPSAWGTTAQNEFTGTTGGFNGNCGAVYAASGTELDDCNVYYAALVGIEVRGSGSEILGCSDYWSGCDGVQTGSSANSFTLMYDDIEYNNTRNFSTEWAAAGIKLIDSDKGGSDPQVYGATITECDIGYNNGPGIWSDSNDTTGENPIVISDNLVRNNISSPLAFPVTGTALNTDAGIKIEVSTNVQVYGNVVLGNGPVGILLAGCEYCTVDNNTVSSNVGYGAIVTDTDGNRTDVVLKNSNYYQLIGNAIENNLISHNDTTYDLVLDILPTSVETRSNPYTGNTGLPLATDNYSDYNLFYRVGEPVQISYGDPDDNVSGEGVPLAMGNLQTSLADWSALTAAGSFTYNGNTYTTGLTAGLADDAHSIFADPVYGTVTGVGWSYNQATGVYTPGNYYVLSDTSPAIGRGDPNVSIYSPDYQQVTQTTSYIGAYGADGNTTGHTYTIPVLDGEAWVDDALPSGAVVFSDARRTVFEYLNNSGSYVTPNSTGVSVYVDMPMWENTTGVDSIYEWGAGYEDGGTDADALETPDLGQSTTTANIMSFQKATQTMTISSTSDTLYFYVWEASSSTSITPALTTPTEIGISFYDSTKGEWLSAYSGATNMNTGTIPILPNLSSTKLSGTPSAGSWVKLSISASALGMATGDVINGLTLAAYGGEAAFDNIGDTPGAAPVAPSEIVAKSVSSSEIAVSWLNNSSNQTGFKIYRAPVTNATSFSLLATVTNSASPGTTITYDDTTVSSSVGTYYYEVESYNASGTSAPGTAMNTGDPGNTSPLVSTQATGRIDMVGAWDFEDDQQGVLAGDSSGNTNTGTLQNGASLLPGSGEIGDGVSVNGSSGYVNVPSSSTLDQSTGDFTLEAWVYISRYGVQNYSGIDKEGSFGILFLTTNTDAGTTGSPTTTNPEIEFYINNPTSTADIAVTPLLDSMTNSQTMSTLGVDQWIFLTATWGGAQPRIWVDNQVYGSVSFSGTMSTNTNSFTIGLGEGSNYFRGSIDEVNLNLGRELDNTEIGEDWALGDYGTPGGTVHAAVVAAPASGAIAAPLTTNSSGQAITSATNSTLTSGSTSSFDSDDDVLKSIFKPRHRHVFN